MKSVNSKLKALSAIVAAGIVVMAGAASAQTVTSGGATLPQPMYSDIISNGPIVGTWSYAATGSGPGKAAFLTNNSALFGTTGTVHIVGSDSALSSGELSTYNAAYNNGPFPGSTVAQYGRLVQVPVVATPVLLPYKETGVTTLNLSTEEICKIYSFDSTARTWDQVTTAPEDGGVGTASAIEVVYRTGTSGTTELLSRFLNAACGSYLPSGKSFTVSNNFKTVVASALPALTSTEDANTDGLPDVWVAATGNAGVETAAAAVHRLAYLSPSFSFLGTDNSVVAKINGFQPDGPTIQASLPAPPVGVARNNPLNWVPAYAYTPSSYPIYGTTNVLVGQCYADVAGSPSPQGAAVKNFLTNFNNGTYDPQIGAYHFVKLPAAWNTAIAAAFLGSSGTLAINDASVCAGIGRP